MVLTKGCTLIWAVVKRNRKIVNYLHENGANLEAQEKDGTTPLIKAMYNQDLKMVKLLLTLGAQPTADAIGEAEKLSESGPVYKDILFQLLTGKAPQEAVVASFTKHVADGKLSDVKRFVKQVTWITGKQYFEAAISAAIDNGQAKVVEYLIKTQNANINAKDNNELKAAIYWLSPFLTQATTTQKEKWEAGLASDIKRYDEVVKVIKKEQERLGKLIKKNDEAQTKKEHRELMEAVSGQPYDSPVPKKQERSGGFTGVHQEDEAARAAKVLEEQ
jgi:hypothetical protein